MDKLTDIFIFLYVSFAICAIIGIPFMLWKSSCTEAEIFNERNQTNYTCGDFFWGGNQINSQFQTIKIEK
jgi:hypothetical protein